MFITRLRRKTQIRKRKGGRETLAEDAVRFQVKSKPFPVREGCVVARCVSYKTEFEDGRRGDALFENTCLSLDTSESILSRANPKFSAECYF